jgi:hypothetical protein
MKINLPSYENAVHCELRQEYSIDWTHGIPQRYKKVKYGTYWRIYEGDRYAFMHSGDNQPFIRKDFGVDTHRTAEILLSSELPVLYTRDGTKVIKKHTYPQIEQRYGKKVRNVDAPTCLVDREFGVVLPLAYNSHIYLPYATAQPLIAGKSNTSFMVHHVTRAIQKEYTERAAYVSDRAKAMIAVLDDSKKCADLICSAKKFDPVIAQDFKAGRFDHWTMEMYLRAYSEYANTRDALYDLSPSERHERLYLDRGPR